MSASTSTAPYRQYLPDLSQPRFQDMSKQDSYEYASIFETSKNPPWLHALVTHWRSLLAEPFKGVTSDGKVRPGVFDLEDQGVPVDKIASVAEHFLSLLQPEAVRKVCYHIDAPEWRTWSNPEFLLSNKGIRLDEQSEEVRAAVLDILRSTLSTEGYSKAVSAMRINGFLGQLVKGETVMNEFSYNFVIFGRPSADRPWGWQIYGHHLCLNVFLYKNQIFVAPWFTGAEPNLIDDGPYKGTAILRREEALGLELMQSLSPELQKKATVFEHVDDPKFPPGRWNRDDQRHLCGAYRDNRVVPYEGISYSEMQDKQKQLVRDIVDEYLLYLPEQARKKHLDRILSFSQETYFCWIGGHSDEDPFYFRIQNPAIIVEFDHHSGVFLTNSHPCKFHIHTLLRYPNAGDYGNAIKPLIPAVEDVFTWSPEDPSAGPMGHASRTK